MVYIENTYKGIAQYLIKKSFGLFRCASIEKNIWFEFRNHRWIAIYGRIYINGLISNQLIPRLDGKRNKLYYLAEQEGHNQMEKKTYIEKALHLSELIKSCENSAFCSEVYMECADLVYDAYFFKKMDEIPHLICFNNGVYDFKNNIFRKGEPDDYITLCTNYDYESYDALNPISIEINNFMEKIQPNKLVREYLLSILASCIDGSVIHEYFYILNGTMAANKIMRLMEYVMGDLAKPMDAQMLDKWDSDSESEFVNYGMMSDKKGIRLCHINGNYVDDDVSCRYVKSFIGRDLQSARIYCTMVSFKPQFKLFLICNGNLPNFESESHDAGTWRRIKLITFNNDCAPDIYLYDKMMQWRSMFMAMLIEYHKKLKAGNLVHPTSILNATTDYRTRCIKINN